MPGGDRTGPMVAGPMTGRGMGVCGGHAGAGRFVRGCGMGFGGRGNRNRFGNSASQSAAGVPMQQELSGLKQHAEFLHSELGEINRRIEQLEKSSAE